MKTDTLTTDWWTAPDWINPDRPAFTLEGDPCEYTFAAAEPSTAAVGAPITEGLYELTAPLTGMLLYLRCPSGTADVYWAERDGLALDTAKIGHAYSGDAGADEDFEATAEPAVGFDDATARSGANPYEFRGYLTTGAGGITAATGLQAVLLVLRLAQWRPGRTLRVYGLEYVTDQSGNITDWDTLDNRTKTTEFAEVTLSTNPVVSLDITDIIAELQQVSGWSGTAPLQFFVEDTGAAVTDVDARAVISGASIETRVPILENAQGGCTWDWDSGANDWALNTDGCAVGFTATPPARSGSSGEVNIPGTCEP